LGASCVGAELLKCLLLSGIGEVLLIDNVRTTEQDAAVNFFLPPTTVGTWRAQALARSLEKLNPFVRIERRVGSITSFVSEWTFDQAFSVVMSTQGTQIERQLLADRCWSTATPLLMLDAKGAVGYITPQFPELVVFHGGQQRNALSLDRIRAMRLLEPFPELKAWCLERFWPLSQWTERQLAEIPWPVLIVLAQSVEPNVLQVARGRCLSRDGHSRMNTPQVVSHDSPGFCLASHSSLDAKASETTKLAMSGHPLFPETSIPAENEAIVPADAHQRPARRSHQDHGEERGLLERVAATLQAWQPRQPLSNWNDALSILNRLIKAEQTLEPPIMKYCLSSQNWRISRVLHAIQTIRGKHGWPVCRELPELSGHPETIAALRRLYHEQADRDVEIVCRHLNESKTASEESIPQSLVRDVCSHLFSMTVRQTPKYNDRARSGASVASSAESTGEIQRSAGWLLALHAYEILGESGAPAMNDEHGIRDLLEATRQLAQRWGWRADLVTLEQLRYFQQAIVEPQPAIPIMLGALAAQEAVKLAIQRFEPLTDTLVYDGYANTATILGEAMGLSS
jgi:hypothetical protein